MKTRNRQEQLSPDLFVAQTPEEMFSHWETILRVVSKLALRSNRKLALLIVALVVDVLLTFGIGYDTVHLHDLTVHDQQIACMAGNQFRHDEKQLWEHVLSITAANPKTPPTPAELKQRAEFQSYLNIAMASRNCATTLK
jgi:hypothetical protein